MDLALRDRVALVTGASRGIGLAIAHSLLQEGVKLGICARGEEGLTEAARELRAAGGEVFAQVCDVREREAVDAFVQGAAEALESKQAKHANPAGHCHERALANSQATT